MTLAGRTVTALSWNVGASGAAAVILLLRTTFLTRWIAPQDFGTYTLAYAIVAGTSVFAGFGLTRAFIHRSPETTDEQQAAATHFTLSTLFALVWCLLLLSCALVFAVGDMRTALFAIAPAVFGILLTQTPRAIYLRRVMHRRLALLLLVNVSLTTAVSLPLAWSGAGLWALLATDLVAMIVHITFLYGPGTVWTPRFRWSSSSIRYFLRFGGQSMTAEVLDRALTRLDDIWAGVYLGRVPLGHYSRAYAFAARPTQLLAGPVNAVAGGTYAELKGNRLGLSRAFFRINAFLIRAGFLAAGLAFLVMPEFIAIVLTDTWLPMLPAFRLMLLFTLISPIRTTLADLYMAVGNPRRVVHARLIQLFTLVAGLYMLGTLWGITGVALAVDGMLVVGIGFLLAGAGHYVDYSPRRLLLVPSLALSVGLLVPYGALWAIGSTADHWLGGVVKVISFSTTYFVIILALEWEETKRMLSIIRTVIRQATGSEERLELPGGA